MDGVMKLTVKQWRLIKGKTQEEFAKEIGMALSTYKKRESGATMWKADEIARISDFLQISLDKQLKF